MYKTLAVVALLFGATNASSQLADLQNELAEIKGLVAENKVQDKSLSMVAAGYPYNPQQLIPAYAWGSVQLQQQIAQEVQFALNEFLTLSNTQTSADLAFGDADLIAKRYTVPVASRVGYAN